MSVKDLYIEGSNVAPVVKALSNEVRLKILSLLSDQDMNIQTIANHLKISKTAVLTHINLLEEAGFIKSQYLSGSVGNQRVCHNLYDRLIFNFNPKKNMLDDRTYYESEILVGNYFDFDAWSPCGLATHNHIIKKWDSPSVFCDPERVEATLVWTAFGYVEYKIPVDAMFIGKRVTALSLEMEVAAHAMVKYHKAMHVPPYMELERITDGVSDITVWVNDREIGTCTYGVGEDPEKATYTPSWWRSLPQHGFALRIDIDKDVCRLNGLRTSNNSFSELIGTDQYFRLRLGVKPDACHCSGLMIFGKGFGRFCHDIVVRSFIE